VNVDSGITWLEGLVDRVPCLVCGGGDGVAVVELDYRWRMGGLLLARVTKALSMIRWWGMFSAGAIRGSVLRGAR